MVWEKEWACVLEIISKGTSMLTEHFTNALFQIKHYGYVSVGAAGNNEH